MKSTRKNKTVKKQKKEGGALSDFFSWKTGIVQRKSTPGYNIIYASKNKIINCEVCGYDIFTHIDVSVSRSKVMNFITNDDGTLADHPLTLYRCKNCNNCKVFYRLVNVSDAERPIKEILVNEQDEQVRLQQFQRPPPPPPQEPPK